MPLVNELISKILDVGEISKPAEYYISIFVTPSDLKSENVDIREKALKRLEVIKQLVSIPIRDLLEIFNALKEHVHRIKSIALPVKIME